MVNAAVDGILGGALKVELTLSVGAVLVGFDCLTIKNMSEGEGVEDDKCDKEEEGAAETDFEDGRLLHELYGR